MNVFVTNRSEVPLTVGYDGTLYEFKKNVPVELPYDCLLYTSEAADE